MTIKIIESVSYKGVNYNKGDIIQIPEEDINLFKEKAVVVKTPAFRAPRTKIQQAFKAK